MKNVHKQHSSIRCGCVGTSFVLHVPICRKYLRHDGCLPLIMLQNVNVRYTGPKIIHSNQFHKAGTSCRNMNISMGRTELLIMTLFSLRNYSTFDAWNFSIWLTTEHFCLCWSLRYFSFDCQRNKFIFELCVFTGKIIIQ